MTLFHPAFLATVCVLQLICLAALVWQFHRRRQAEAAARRQHADLAHAARLGLAGELTASIVHEVNQPLGAILSNVDAALLLMQREPPPLDLIGEILTDIRADDLRASDVIRQLRELLKKREIELEPLQLNELVTSAERIVGNLAIRHGVSLRIQLEEQLPLIEGDRTHLLQVLINLALNAMEAMAIQPQNSRRLLLRTRRSHSGKVALEVQDSGPGVPSQLQPQLFEPFFTTKPDGMGMGLTIAKTIVSSHHGTLEAVSTEQGGALFRVRLPAGRVRPAPTFSTSTASTAPTYQEAL